MIGSGRRPTSATPGDFSLSKNRTARSAGNRSEDEAVDGGVGADQEGFPWSAAKIP
jgi:hypothetical protein